jgi:hypothetical protein
MQWLGDHARVLSTAGAARIRALLASAGYAEDTTLSRLLVRLPALLGLYAGDLNRLRVEDADDRARVIAFALVFLAQSAQADP